MNISESISNVNSRYKDDIVKECRAEKKNNGQFVMKDKNGKDIYSTDKFNFLLHDYVENKKIELIGSFCWNADELRYEVDIYYRTDYACLSYDYQKMSEFELLPK